jgi:hypothetical protein
VAGNLSGCDEPRSVQAVRARGLLIVAGEDVVDSDVHGDGLQADALPQGGDDMPLDVACHVVDGISVGDRHGEVDDSGAAEDADCGMGMTVLEAGLFGEFSVYHTSRTRMRIWLMTSAVRPGGAGTGRAAVSITGAHRAANSASAA